MAYPLLSLSHQHFSRCQAPGGQQIAPFVRLMALRGLHDRRVRPQPGVGEKLAQPREPDGPLAQMGVTVAAGAEGGPGIIEVDDFQTVQAGTLGDFS